MASHARKGGWRAISASLRDRIAGSVLLVLALVWIVLVYQTIEPSQGDEAGPRAFPLFFGFVLAGLSLIVLVQSFRPGAAPAEEEVEPTMPGEGTAVVITIAGLTVYGFLLEPLGFIPSTALGVAAMMVFALGVRSPWLVGGMALGLSFGSYAIFGKLLGTYLPPGTLMPIYF